jgi:putative transposase
MSELRACRVVNQTRGTQRYRPAQREEEEKLTGAILQLASQYGRYGYRRITALPVQAGWKIGRDRVERISPTDENLSVGDRGIWRREGG